MEMESAREAEDGCQRPRCKYRSQLIWMDATKNRSANQAGIVGFVTNTNARQSTRTERLRSEHASTRDAQAVEKDCSDNDVAEDVNAV